MIIEQLKKMANNKNECDYLEVQMHALVSIAESLEIILSVLQDERK